MPATQTQTISKEAISDQRIPAGQSGSSKNDVSEFRAASTLRRNKKKPALDKKEKRLVMKNRLSQLQLSCQGKTAKQKKDIQALKESDLFINIKHQISLKQQYSLSDIYDLMIILGEITRFDQWDLSCGQHQIALFTSYQSIFPGLRFKCLDGFYQPLSFHYNIRISL